MDEVTPAQPLRECMLAVPADACGVSAGRKFVESVLQADVGPAAAVAGGLVVQELLANAVTHGRPPITVHVLCYENRVRLEVADGCRSGPVPTRGGGGMRAGCGMAVVERLCRKWGNHRRSDGKSLWAELDACPRSSIELQVLLRLWLDDDG